MKDFIELKSCLIFVEKLNYSVIKSRCEEFPEGSQVVGYFGWRDLTIYKPVKGGIRFYQTIQKLPEMKGLPDSYALGCMGMPG